jgi:hypothetical protein
MECSLQAVVLSGKHLSDITLAMDIRSGREIFRAKAFMLGCSFGRKTSPTCEADFCPAGDRRRLAALKN